MKNISSLLKKKGWTGKEVGKLLFSSLINDIKNHGDDKKILFSQSEFEKIESSLKNDKDIIVYNVYRALYLSIIDSFNRGQGLYQQFYNGFNRLFLEFREIQNTDKANSLMDNTPVILTENQYNRLRKKAEENLRSNYESYYSLFFSTLYEFLNNEDNAPDYLKKAIEETKKETAASKYLSKYYNDIMGEGYYMLPDGKRSDNMTSDEWQDVLEKEFLKTHKLTINGKEATPAETVEEFTSDRLIKSYNLFYDGAEKIKEFVYKETGVNLNGSNQEIESSLEDLILSRSALKPNDPLAKSLEYESSATWYTYKEIDESLTAYDLLDPLTDFSNYESTDKKELLKNFKSDFSNLYSAINTYLEENVPETVGLKANQLYKNLVTWGSLADNDIDSFKSLTEPSNSEIITTMLKEDKVSNSYSNRIRANINGIAILKNPNSFQLDKNGNYKETKNPLSFYSSLYSLQDDPEEQKRLTEYTSTLILPALRYLYAFNTLIEIISSVYDLPNLTHVAQYDTKPLECRIESYNNLIKLFYFDVYGDKEEKEVKRRIIKEFFKPIETDNLHPRQDVIDEITAELEKLSFSSEARRKLTYLDKYLNRLIDNKRGN